MLQRLIQSGMLAVALLGLAILTGISGCAVRAPAMDSLAEMQGQLPADAWLRDGVLVVRFDADPGRTVFAVANWQRAQSPMRDYAHGFARLDYVDNDWPEDLPPRREFQRLQVLPSERWTALLTALTDQLVPETPGDGLLLVVQRSELVIYRDDDGKLISVPLRDKPAHVEVVNSCDQLAFLRRAADVLESFMAELELPDRVFLFQADPGDQPGSHFILVDLDEHQLVSINSALPAEVVDDLGLVGLSAQGATSVVVRSHLITLLKNPVTSLARLFNFAVFTTYNLVKPHARRVVDNLPEVGNGVPMDLEQWERDLDDLVSSRPYRGSVQYLIDGEAFFSELIDDIARAGESILMRMYIFDRDDYAVRIADLLKARSAHLKVRVLMDDLGSIVAGSLPPGTPMPPDFEPPASIAEYLKQDSEIRVRRVSNPWFTADHTKAIVIDSEVAYTGGMNIGREYRYEWHDMMVRLEGPIAGRILRDFAKAWAHAGIGGDLAYAWKSAFQSRPNHDSQVPGQIWIRPLYTHTGRRDIFRAHVGAIRRAGQYIYIQNAYLSDNTVLGELVDARARGVDVRVILPSGNDSGIMAASNVVTANTLIAHGVRVYAYPGMTHIKATIIDGWASLGSANFDKLSFFINQEMNVAFSDPEAVEQLRSDLFEADFRVAEEITEPIEAGWSDYLYEVVANQF